MNKKKISEEKLKKTVERYLREFGYLDRHFSNKSEEDFEEDTSKMKQGHKKFFDYITEDELDV